MPKGFEFLADLGDHPDPAKSVSGAGPLENRGTPDDATLVRHLAPLRTVRVWWPARRCRRALRSCVLTVSWPRAVATRWWNFGPGGDG